VIQRADNPLLRNKRSYSQAQVHAHYVVQQAIKHGDLKRADKCAWCNESASTVAHHADYSKSLGVEWLCRSCNTKEGWT